MASKKILVIGDSCRDVFIYGSASRLCPDAPVPVFVEEYEVHNGGMALNVYNNLSGIDGVECDIKTNEELVTKTRYVDKRTNQMLLRVDSGEEKIARCRGLEQVEWSKYDAVVVSDYNKGFLLEEDILFITKRHKVVFLDTKKLLRDWYTQVPFIKINETEYVRTQHLLGPTNNLIVTCGSGGCRYLGKTYPVPHVDVKDTSGAGDTFLAALAGCYSKTNNIDEAIVFANTCATEAVKHRGVYVINDST